MKFATNHRSSLLQFFTPPDDTGYTLALVVLEGHVSCRTYLNIVEVLACSDSVIMMLDLCDTMIPAGTYNMYVYLRNGATPIEVTSTDVLYVKETLIVSQDICKNNNCYP